MDDFLRYMQHMDAYREMTPDEQFQINFILECAERHGAIIGKSETRYEICLAIYNAYVSGIEKGKKRTV